LARLEAFTAVKIQVVVVCVVVRYQCFRGPCCLKLHPEELDLETIILLVVLYGCDSSILH